MSRCIRAISLFSPKQSAPSCLPTYKLHRSWLTFMILLCALVLHVFCGPFVFFNTVLPLSSAPAHGLWNQNVLCGLQWVLPGSQAVLHTQQELNYCFVHWLAIAWIIFFFLIWLCWVLVVACAIFCCGARASFPAACGILVSGPGIESGYSALQDGFLITGQPGKSPIPVF